MDRDTAELIDQLIGSMLSILVPAHRYQALAEASHAIDAGTATDEQLVLVTNIVHNAFDVHDGCMVAVLREMIDNGAPHYFVNHAIRTYVRKCDKRESDVVKEREESLNARYGKAAQKEAGL